ncbi:hypothetical protein LP415_13855 [Polaromonas sp. P1(28)-8]|nr:hypothetical protein LP415_13855 [Polaromonas sp. P1(28)-8]
MDAQQTLEVLSAARFWRESVLIRDLARMQGRRGLHVQVKCCLTVYWYEALRERAAVQSAWAMQTAFAMDSFKELPGAKRHSSNIWLKYRDGKHKPTAKTLRRVEALCPGSSTLISDQFWSLLLREQFSHVSAQRLLKRLPQPLKSALFKKDKHGRLQRDPHWERWSGTRSDRDFVQLSAFVILAHEALQSGQRLAADKWSYKVFEAFTHLGPKLMRYRVGRALFQVLDLLIFSRTDISTNDNRYVDLRNYPRPTDGHVAEDELENYNFWLDEMSKATCRMIYQDLSASTLTPSDNLGNHPKAH